MLYIIRASLLAVSNSVDLEATVDCDAFSFSVLCFDFLTLFGVTVNTATQKVEVKSLVQNNKVLKNKVDLFIEKYNFLSASMYQLRAYLQKLAENEHIIFYWGAHPTRDQGLPLYSQLLSLKNGGNSDKFEQIYHSLFTDFLSKYDVLSFHSNDRKRVVGEYDKTKRICRFCNNKREKVTFKNKAHAISESLGNKTIILNEECDECNSAFGSGIERDLIAYLKPYTIIFGIKGKNGIPTYKGKNFILSRNNDGGVDLNYFLTTGEEKGKFPVTLKTLDTITMQNIYRTLCKYAMSVIDGKYLAQFTETLAWIKGEKQVAELPKVAILKSYRLVTDQPKITLSMRTDVDYCMPFAVGEFRCMYLTFVFIIPLSVSDNKSFIDNDQYSKFWQFFKHYSSINEWEFVNFSDNKKKENILQMTMNTPTDYALRHI